MAKKVFFAGIGGMGMTPLAIYLSELGFNVTGWDDVYIPDNAKQWFLAKNIKIADKIPENCDFFVYSNAVKADNALYIDAVSKSIEVVRRGEFLAKILLNKRVFAIVGSHGKSSVCALTVHLLKELDVDFSYLIGAHLQNDSFLPSRYCKNSDIVVVEVDESDGSINNFIPHATIVLNDALDHTSFYKSQEQYVLALQQIAQKSKSQIFLSKQLSWAESFKVKENDVAFGRVKTFGQNGDFGLIANEDGAVVVELLGEFSNTRYCLNKQLSLNNLAAALTLTFNITGGLLPSQGAIKRFAGVKRRCEVLLKTDKLTVISDYAHHPDEINTYLQYAKAEYSGEQVVIYEPHRASRTIAFHKEFGQALDRADKVLLKNVYQAFEDKIDPAVNNLISQHLNNTINEAYLDVRNFFQMLESFSGKITLSFVGAGNIDAYARNWVENFLELVFQNICNATDSVVQKNVSLANKSTIGIGGNAFLYIEPSDDEGLRKTLIELNKAGINWFVLGLGSNVLIPTKRFNGAVLSLSNPHWGKIEQLSDFEFEVGTGIALKKLVDFMQSNGVGGFEFLDCIPGTVGGALKMNAGAHESCIFELVKEIFLIDKNANSFVLSKDNADYAYRSCKSLENTIATKVILRGFASTKLDISEKRRAFRQSRINSQPIGKSLGCFFKNTIDAPAGKLLDSSGLKGKEVSGVYISPKHANFIINKAGCFEDILKIVDIAQTTVFQKTGKLLQPEVELLGEKWTNLL